MRRLAAFIIAAGAFALAACGQPSAPSAPLPDVGPVTDTTTAPVLPEVDAALLATPNSEFVAVEAGELGVIAATDIHESLGPLIATEAGEGESSLQLSIRTMGEESVADVVRTGMADDAVSGGHLRIVYAKSGDDWTPVGAYRRVECRRGAGAGTWSKGPCP